MIAIKINGVYSSVDGKSVYHTPPTLELTPRAEFVRIKVDQQGQHMIIEVNKAELQKALQELR